MADLLNGDQGRQDRRRHTERRTETQRQAVLQLRQLGTQELLGDQLIGFAAQTRILVFGLVAAFVLTALTNVLTVALG